MKRLCIIFIITFVLVLVKEYTYAQEQESTFLTYKQATHVLHAGESIILKWAEFESAHWYEVWYRHVEREIEKPVNGGLYNKTWTRFKLPYSGHYVFRMRACRDLAEKVSDPPITSCNPWVSSDDNTVGKVGEDTMGWWIYAHTAPPGTPVVE